MKHVVLTLLIIVCLSASAQDWAKTQAASTKPAMEGPLKIGDRIPFGALHNMINYPKESLRLADHKPKLLLLDFWETTCGPCIKFWPTALKLQEEFGADLQIVLINNREDVKTVKDFLARRKRIDNLEMNLPVSCRDSLVRKSFYAGSLPQYAWIDQNGVLGAITSGKEVTRENIKRWITTGPFTMKNLNEVLVYSVIPHKPIFVNGNGGDKPGDVFIWTSSLTKGQTDNGANPFIFYDEVYGISITNSDIIHLYGHANNNRLREFDVFDFLPLSRIDLIAKDTAKYYSDNTLGGNTFNYQLLAGKPQSRGELMSMMRQDLQRYFGLKVTWEKRVKKCFVISMFDSSLAAKRTSLGPELKMRDRQIVIDSTGVKDLTTLMEMGTWNYRNWKYPIVDETGYKGLITGLRETGDGEDPAVLDKVLQKYGMRLKLEMREVDVLVLREPN